MDCSSSNLVLGRLNKQNRTQGPFPKPEFVILMIMITEFELGSFIYPKKLAMYKTCETTSHLPRLQHAHMPLNGHADCIPSDMTCSRRALPTLVNAMSHELRLAASRVYGLPGIRGFGGRAAHNRIVKSAEHVASRGSFGWKLVS